MVTIEEVLKIMSEKRRNEWIGHTGHNRKTWKKRYLLLKRMTKVVEII